MKFIWCFHWILKHKVYLAKMNNPPVLFGVILFSCIVTRASAFLLRAVNCLVCVDCLRRGVGSLRLQPCSEAAVRSTSLMLFHSLYAAWSFVANSTNKFNKAFIRSHHRPNTMAQGPVQLRRLKASPAPAKTLRTFIAKTYCFTDGFLVALET